MSEKPSGSPRTVDSFLEAMTSGGAGWVQLASETRQAPAIDSLRPATWLEGKATQLVFWCFGAVVCVGIVLVLVWAMTRPTAREIVEEMRQMPTTVPSALAPEKILELLDRRRQAHFETLQNWFTMLIVGVLYPFLTLVTGYVFGRLKENQQSQV